MKAEIPPRLFELMEEAAQVMPTGVASVSTFDGGEAFTVEDQIRLGINLAESEAQKQALRALQSKLGATLRGLAVTGAADCLFVRNTKFYAYLTILPSTLVGRTIRLEQVLKRLAEAEVVRGIDRGAVEAAFAKSADTRELIWDLRVARGRLPERGPDARLDFVVRFVDHALLFGEKPPAGPLRGMFEPVQPAQVLARLSEAGPGKGGLLVTGKRLPAPHGRELPWRLGGGVRVNRATGDVVAKEAGCVVLANASLDVVPVLDRDPANGPIWTTPTGSIEHAGAVLVRGSVQGPGRIVARDAYVEGDLRDVAVEVERDLWVGGCIAGAGDARVRTGGRVRAQRAEHARIDALGPVTILEESRGSRIRSGNWVQFGPDGRGRCRSGDVEAINRITAGTVGEEGGAGPGVKLTVGWSEMAAERVTEIAGADRQHEEALAAIAREKERALSGKDDAGRLSIERQQACLELMQREVREAAARRSLRESLDRLRAATQPEGQARIEVLRRFDPPGQVRVGSATLEIREPLESPRFTASDDGRVSVEKLRK